MSKIEMKEYKDLLYQVLNLMPKIFGKGDPPEFYGPLLKEIQRLSQDRLRHPLDHD